ncbi:MAG: SigE family RNA polymerase sigma factor [Actinomycetota bacterium]|nr:SigE family RNA polymerase sigma factor [Actinomycetota bacterium]
MTFDTYARSRLPALLRTATAITGDSFLGEDLVQEVLVKLHAHWPRLGEVEHLDAYVRRMLVNQYVSWRRKWSRLVPTAVIPEQAVLDHADRIADRDLLDRGLADLPPRQRIAMALRYLDGLSDADIAAAMACSESSVRSFISRGLVRLRIHLDAPATTPGGVR